MQKNRQGSIPLVLLIIIVLGIGAASSIFMTSSTARIDKHSELNTHAWSMAQAAVEEVLVRLTNGSASWDYDLANRYTYAPNSTLQVAADIGSERGIEIDISDVEVMGRLAEKKGGDEEEREKFLAYLHVGTHFGYEAMNAKGYTAQAANAPWVDWLESNAGSQPSWWSQDFIQEMVTNNFKAAPGHEAERLEYFDHVKDYEDERVDPSTADNNGSTRLGEAYNALPYTLTEEPWETQPLEVQVANAAGRAAQLTEFYEAWNLAMDANADKVEERIANCDGNLNYGFGAMLGGFLNGVGVQADGDAEEDLRETGQAGGNLAYNASLVTVSANVTAKAGGVQARQQVTAHRLVASTSATETAAQVRQQTLLHLMYFYNLTPGDFVWMEQNIDGAPNLITVQTDGTNDESGMVTGLNAENGMWTKLYERLSDLAGVRVMPFQAATCLAKVRG